MMKEMLAMTAAIVFFSAITASAMVIDFGESKVGQTFQIEEIDSLDNWQSEFVPVVEGTVTNDGEVPATFKLTGMSVGYGNFSLEFVMDFIDLGVITLAPGETITRDLIKVGAFTQGYNPNDFFALPVGTREYINSFIYSFEVDGSADNYSIPVGSGGFLWEIEVVAASDSGGTTPVPEPTTMLLFGAGLAGLAAVGRKKK